MSDDIKPALTPQEWTTFRLWRADKMPGGHVPVYKTVEQWSPEHKHAGAAQCLYGQPFGFTWDDVSALGWVFAQLEWAEEKPDIVQLRSLADRIAALLPPE